MALQEERSFRNLHFVETAIFLITSAQDEIAKKMEEELR